MSDQARVIVSNDAVRDEEIFSPEVLALLAHLEAVHRPRRQALLHQRVERAAELRGGARPSLLAETAEIRQDLSWSVPPAPPDLTDRRCEITGPSDAKMMVSALNSGARVFMSDLEDALSPSWTNLVAAQCNLRDYARGSLSFERPDGQVETPRADHATLVIRPRGLHLEERHVLVGEAPVSGGLFDVVLAGFHGARALEARSSGLYLYLPKLESHEEASWWDRLLSDLEQALGIRDGSIRVTVLIETILAAYQMEEIMYALRRRLTGLNAGRWDYIFSIIKKFGTDHTHVLPDRSQITMSVPFMAAYAERLVALCHRRGAHAIGGMSAFIPNRRKPEVTERAIAAVRADKDREAKLGYDGTWVAHPDLVPVATEVFDRVLANAPNQLAVRAPLQEDVAALLATDIPGAQRTLFGLRLDIEVSLVYLESWLGGRGAVAIFDLMEDLATAEISRSQIWQWLYHESTLEDGQKVTTELLESELGAIVDRLINEGHDRARILHAASVLHSASISASLPDFLTSVVEPDPI